MRRWLSMLVLAVCATACGAGGEPDAADFLADPDPSEACLLRLHGKGGDGSPWRLRDDAVTVISPRGNDAAWDAYQWDYLDESGYREALAIVEGALAAFSCERTVVYGFSNGAAMAVALHCGGDLTGVIGYVVDDPVTDAASVGCDPTPGVDVAVYWTGDLERAAPIGTDCGSLDWTCLGGVVRGIDAVAADLGVAWQASVHETHTPFDDAPELTRWFS